MKSYLFVVAAIMPAMIASASAAAVPSIPQPTAKTTMVSPVNFLDNILQGKSRHHHKTRTSHRQQPAAPEEKAEAPAGGTPSTIPVPQPRPADDKAAAAPPSPETEPKPVPKPSPDTPAKVDSKEKPASENAPQDPAKPDNVLDTSKEAAPAEPEGAPDKTDSQPEIVHEDPAKLQACLSELGELGAKFSKAEPIQEGDGCGIEAPLKVAEILPGLSLGGALMRCETALDLAHWLKDGVQPALSVAMPGRRITGISPGTTYACRLRNSATTGVISEHARGNGFDVAAFRLDNGESIEMKPREDDHGMDGAFQKALVGSACLYFTTVLAPGSDASHETHMHVDIKDRKAGYRICEVQ